MVFNVLFYFIGNFSCIFKLFVLRIMSVVTIKSIAQLPSFCSFYPQSCTVYIFITGSYRKIEQKWTGDK